MVTKYVVELSGVLAIDREPVHFWQKPTRKPIYVRQKSTTVLKDLGASVFDVPDAVRRKLEQVNPEPALEPLIPGATDAGAKGTVASHGAHSGH